MSEATLTAEGFDRIAEIAVTGGPQEAAERLENMSTADALEVIGRLNPAVAEEVLTALEDPLRESLLAAGPESLREQWNRNRAYPDGSIGKLMETPTAVFRPENTVGDAIARLEKIVRRAFVTYGWVTDPAGRLQGVIVFRDLLFARREQTLREIMVANPFFLDASAPVADAMKDAVKRHFPVYPVCDGIGRLIGIVRGQTLFEQQAFELSAQVGSTVGVDKEERLGTPWLTSLRFRHPWLQINLLTAFAAAAVVSTFESTIDQLVVLAVFLPVLAGQSGNTGCQAMAVMLRAITLGEIDSKRASKAVVKEMTLGLCNGALVGVTAGLAMYYYASNLSGDPNAPAFTLASVVALAMTGSCMISGLAGAIVPLVLKRFGADPATASSIFLTTATDVASMGMFLSLAKALVLG